MSSVVFRVSKGQLVLYKVVNNTGSERVTDDIN
jgi:hypothetical protein